MRTSADLSENVRPLVVDGRDAWRDRDYKRARRLFEQALRVSRESGDTFGEVAAYHFLGNLAFNECDDEESRRLHLAALQLSRLEGDEQGVATSLGSLALIDVAAGDLESARRRYDSAGEAYERAGMPEAAESLRTNVDALLSGRVKLEAFVHRTGPAEPIGEEA
jgi:tetratricopeptide (TPR) repeat protein